MEREASPANWRNRRIGSRKYATYLAFVSNLLLLCGSLRADEPYARSRDYDLQHSKIILHFDVDQKKVFGDVTHSLSILRDGTSRIALDSVGLTIQSVMLNKSTAQFETTANKLIVPLRSAAKAGEKFEIEIRYEGKPAKGLYFILPDKDYPKRPKQIWTQGESEDTRYYLPTYDYPNDRLTTETIVTVPASWITVANGKLMSVVDAGKGMQTWTWKESVPSSTYLITVVAGEFDEVKDNWRGIPLTYYAPKGRGDRLPVNYGRTPAMLELFSKKFGVDYPWEKYAQAMVDDFVAGGMENSSATTNTSTSLMHPKLASEYLTGEDDLISHELAHQWFGDLVTCKDWGHIWLNEGFATFAETVWTEAHFGKDQADYERWQASREWFQNPSLFTRPVVRHDFGENSDEFDGNTYGKAGWVLDMLRHQMGEDAFYRGIKHYLEVNRGKNVVTADFSKAMEEATYTNIDEFLAEWIYGAGGPKFDLAYTYDAEKHQVALTVKQTQKREGRVGLFSAPVDVEIATASGPKLYPITVSKETETFTLPSDSAPLMVLFDRGDHVLKSAEFHKDKKEWLYQLKSATELADRADALIALEKIKNDDEVVSALGEALRNDKTPGIRAQAADALGQIGGKTAAKLLLDALDSRDTPWVRSRIAYALGSIKDDTDVATKLDSVARDDSSYRTRASALQALARLKTSTAFATLTAAVAGDSPDKFLQRTALRAFGVLGDDRAVPLLLEWSVIGKEIDSRTAAISSLPRLEKNNKKITEQIASYLTEPRFPIRWAALNALGMRGDPSAIPALEALLKRDDLTIEVVPTIKRQIARLKNPSKKSDSEESGEGSPAAETEKPSVDQRLDKLEHLIQEMNDSKKSKEGRMPPAKQKKILDVILRKNSASTIN